MTRLAAGGPRILTLDIETRPAVVETWSLHNAFIGVDQIREPGAILGFGYKWRGSRTVDWVSTEDGSGAVPWAARDLLDEADIVVTYNGDAFDLRHLNRDILLEGLAPPSPVKSIDLYRTVKRHFKFQSNRLGFVAEQLGVGAKISTDYKLWRGCMDGDEASWRKMARYCKQDVRVTEALYERLLPWISNHPHIGMWLDSSRPMCPTCGGAELTKQGLRHTVAQSYIRYQCRSCGRWSRGTEVVRRAAGQTRPA